MTPISIFSKCIKRCDNDCSLVFPFVPFMFQPLCLAVWWRLCDRQWQMCCNAASLHERKRKSCLVLHMSALFFRATEVLAPLHWFTHTLPLSVSLCVSHHVNSRMQMSTFSQGAGWLRKACVCVWVCARESFWPRGWEGSDRGLDMLKRQSKWVFLKQ